MTEADIAGKLFALLRQMDAEACSREAAGKALGLCDYGWYARPELKKPQNEVEWSKRLAQLLTLDGFPTSSEVEYPNQAHLPRYKRNRRDLRLQLDESHTISIEVKGAWSDYWGRNNKIYRSYLFHPLIPSATVPKSHTVPLDLLKLSELRRPETDFVGLLLVGFEKLDDPMDVDVDELKALARLSDWCESKDVWESDTIPGQRVRCWFWYRAADSRWSLPVSPLN